MLLIFSMPVLIRHLWQLKTAVFQHRCLILLGVHFPDWLCGPGGLDKDPNVWLDGAGTPSNDQLSTYKSLTNLNI